MLHKSARKRALRFRRSRLPHLSELSQRYQITGSSSEESSEGSNIAKKLDFSDKQMLKMLQIFAFFVGKYLFTKFIGVFGVKMIDPAVPL